MGLVSRLILLSLPLRKHGFFYLLEVIMDTELAIKQLQEDVMYLHRDIAHLCDIIENLQPEIHYHMYYDLRTCMDDPNNTNDLKDLT